MLASGLVGLLPYIYLQAIDDLIASSHDTLLSHRDTLPQIQYMVEVKIPALDAHSLISSVMAGCEKHHLASGPDSEEALPLLL